jgi:hypothetical protein
MQAREIIERLGGQSAVAQHLEKGQSTVVEIVPRPAL